jgi:cysteine desulfurase/selenocysteine lyase
VAIAPYADAFEPFGDTVWLNCAHQGPLPIAAGSATMEAVEWKKSPQKLTSARFREVPARLRRAIAALINSEPDDVILGNSASYGLHLLANALPLEPDSEVLVAANDFPSDILPWLRLEDRGVRVTRMTPASAFIELDDVQRHASAKTRVLCLTWVHSFSGWTIDLDAIGTFCRGAGITFIVNGSQAVGARPVDVRATPIDALCGVGHKWLCGPYGSGFCWVRPEVRDRLRPTKAYWLSMFTAGDLQGTIDVRLRSGLGARAFDIFGTANFFNFTAWTVAIEYLLGIGVDAIAKYDQKLVGRFVDGLDSTRYRLISPASGPRRSTLVVFTAVDSSRNQSSYDSLTAAGIHIALRAGGLRVSPHLYNSDDDIDRALDVLNASSP